VSCCWKQRQNRKPPSSSQLGISLIRKQAKFLGVVEAASAEAAETAAAVAFRLSEEQRKRLLVRERL
jgi:hypothetical protein